MRNPFAAFFERRSASAITSSYALAKALLGRPSLAGTVVSESTALNLAAVMTCVSIRSRALASLPVRVYEQLDERSKRPAVLHPLSRVLSQPNSWQTRAELFGMLEAHRVLRGNAYAWINRVVATSPDGMDREQVAELIPMHPDQVDVVAPKDDFAGGPSYRLTKRNGQVVPLASREVLHLRGLSTDGLVGRSVLEDARELLGGALATQAHSSTFWRSSGIPSVTLRHPKSLTPQAKKNLEDSWAATYGGAEGQKRVAVLEEGMEIAPLTIAASDAQFLETRQFQRGEIAGWFHVPPHMIGDTEKSTSWGTGIEQQQIGFVAFTLRPDLVLWEQRLQRDLISRPDKYFVRFNVNGFMRGDSAAQGAFFRVMREIGAYSANDIRALMDENPIDFGDEYLRPANLTPLGATPAAGTGAA